MSKFPRGLNATDTEICPLGLLLCKREKVAVESETGLQEMKEDEEGIL